MRKKILYLEIAIIFIISLSFFAYLHSLSPYLLSNDSYYHLKYAHLLRTQGWITNFPWASETMWAQTFSDKDLLYHLYLMPFTLANNMMLAVKWASALLSALVMISLYMIMRLNHFRYPWFWYIIIMISGSFFLYRLNAVRPQSLSILLALWSIHFIINNKKYALAVISFIYTMAYTASFLPVLFAVTIALFIYIHNKKLNYENIFYAFLGFLLGNLCHPYFPYNWLFIYIQNFYVLYAHSTWPLDMALELTPFNTRQILYHNTSLLLTLIAIIIASIYQPKIMTIKARQLLALTLLTMLLTMHSKRFMEYFAPILILFASAFFTPYAEQITWLKNNLRKYASAIILSLLVMIALSYQTIIHLKTQFSKTSSTYEKAALVLKEHSKDNDIIFTCDWDDAGELWYYNAHLRYLVFLDPSFMHYWSKKRWLTWKLLSEGAMKHHTYDVLKENYNINLGVCSADFQALKHIITQDQRMRIIYEDNKAFVFSLNPS